MANNGKTKTIREIAEKLGVNEVTVYKWKREGAPVFKEDGYYSVDRIQEWCEENKRSKSDTHQVSDDDEIRRLKTELLRARVTEKQFAGEIKEIKVKYETGQLIEREEMHERDIQRIAVVKSRLLALPRRLAQDMVGLNANQMETMMKTRFREILEQFASM
jgi:phage terminase Nu1 subunit (DNA packaging protein)